MFFRHEKMVSCSGLLKDNREFLDFLIENIVDLAALLYDAIDVRINGGIVEGVQPVA